MYREYGSDKRNNDYTRLIFKAMICVGGIIALLFVVFTYKNFRLKEDKAPYVQINEVFPVLEALVEVNAEDSLQEDRNTISLLLNRFSAQQNETENYLSFEELQTILHVFPLEIRELVAEYKSDTWNVGLEDWNEIVGKLVETYGKGQVIVEDTLLLGMGDQIADEKRIAIADNMIFNGETLLKNRYPNMEDYLFSNVRAVIYEDCLLTVIDYAKESGTLKNVYLADVSGDKVHVFYKGYHMFYPTDVFCNLDGKYEEGKNMRIISDISLEKGSMRILHEKEDYVHGKLLQVSDSSMEIEGYGKYQTDENMQVYKVFGELQSMDRNELRIGYSFSDFVIEDGKIVACLMIKEEDMEYIRVLLKNSDMAGRYHEEVIGYGNQDLEWIEYEDGVEKDRKVIEKGEQFKVRKEDIERSGKRIKLVPSVLSGEIILESVKRSNGTPAYFGSLEITGDENGLLVINEVLLEDYLCKVVPSEMPAFYPKEALMAQAVCARTYAYAKMLNAGLPEYGAHVDDSAGFQVYNNIMEQTSTTDAVKATHNQIAVYEGEPIGAYYYSTSSGMGSDAGIWHGTAQPPEYLQAKEIGISMQENDSGVLFTDAEFTPRSLMQEDVFKKWITDVKDSHYESQEGWYRWSYEVDDIDVAHMEDVLQARYANNPNLILTQSGDEFESKEIGELGEIKDIRIVKRLPGGVADELLITGSKATVKVISELNIRYVLADGVSKVERQTGDEAEALTTLPSAFIMLETKMDDDKVNGYKISGGGFGHGVGMSQNGAKNMANAGMTCEEILSFFYPGATIKTLHFEEES